MSSKVSTPIYQLYILFFYSFYVFWSASFQLLDIVLVLVSDERPSSVDSTRRESTGGEGGHEGARRESTGGAGGEQWGEGGGGKPPTETRDAMHNLRQDT